MRKFIYTCIFTIFITALMACVPFPYKYGTLCVYPQNRPFFGRNSLGALRLSPNPPVFRTNQSRRFAFIPKIARFSDKSVSALCVYPQISPFFGQIMLSRVTTYKKRSRRKQLLKSSVKIKALVRVEYTYADYILDPMRTNLWGLSRRGCND